MYLIPRLIGIGIYAMLLVCFSYLIMRSSLRQTRYIIRFYWLIIGLMGYFFVPPPGFDLTRLYERMHYYAALSFNSLIKIMSGTITPGERLYYWIIGSFGNDHLLPCISGLISFGLCFRILCDIGSKETNTPKEIAIALILFMSRGAIIMAISNIRTFMAISILSWCVYQEMIHGESARKHWLLYAIACSMHTMGYIGTIIRVIFYMFERTKKPKIFLFRMFTVIALFLFSFIFLNSFWQGLLAKAVRYLEESREGTSYSYIWEGVLCGITLLVGWVLLRSIARYKKLGCMTDPGYERICRFAKMLILLTLFLSFVEFNVFLRLGYYLTVLLIPVSLYAMGLARQCGYGIRMRNRIYLFSLVIIALAGTRGYLCSLKFFE